VPDDSQDAEASFKRAREGAEQGLPQGQYELGNCYRYGHGVAEDLGEAMKWYEKAASQGVVAAKSGLADLLSTVGQIRRGKRSAEDSERSAQLYTEAANEGDAHAQYVLGMNHFVPPERDGLTEEQQAHWLLESAKGGYVFALHELGSRLLEGRGIEQNRKAAEPLLLEAAKREYPPAMLKLFHYYSDVDNPYGDRVKALEWLRKAARAEYAFSAFAARVALADAYETGKWGLEVDKKEAFAYRRMANSGEWVGLEEPGRHADVVYKIAQAYETGEGAQRSPEAAANWYEYAAKLGHPEAGDAMTRAQNQARKAAKATRSEAVHSSDDVVLRTTISDDGFHIKWERRGSREGYLLGFRRVGGFPSDDASEEERGTRMLMTAAANGEAVDHGVEGDTTYYYTFVIKESNPDHGRTPGTLEMFSRFVSGEGAVNAKDKFFYTSCASFQIRTPLQKDQLAELAEAKRLIEAQTSVRKAERARDGLINPELIARERREAQIRERLAGGEALREMKNELRKKKDQKVREIERAVANGELSREQGQADIADIADWYQGEIDRL
jgi:TPR repeat protein